MSSYKTGTSLVGAHELFVGAVAAAMLSLLYGFFRFTTLGLKMRAVASNPASSRLVGIRVSWTLALGWGLADVPAPVLRPHRQTTL